ncbi:glycosyltransferase family 39 protein [Thiomicrorhabdus sp. 6S3-12]|uniref:ArnT family glycosyltransferase n=1 Tax=Thiomicrorhabdus sp. 6S3-12 TaxID=2819681 RepID=UPI001AAE0ED0|nr:glycosyltransferase family 39 protein [Thiomicrorhabdus sp. 6S3-12]MBO1923715.1 glycosyltransferase family 39 protein [Thiomicrorhabdus sp. 6S3-12]
MLNLKYALPSLSVAQLSALMLFTALKLVLLWQLPLTGDEAYFIVWGQQLASGYYDHPPAVGWILGLMSLLSENLAWYRSFAFATSLVVAYLLYQWLCMFAEVARDKAFWAAMIFWVSPVSLMFVLTANDTVLVFFAALGFYWFSRALKDDSTLFAVLAGVMLGMAFLSKYFAVFLLFGLLLYVLSFTRRKPLGHAPVNWRLITLMIVIVVLFIAQNLWFNYQHCWNNILFNFFSRTQDSTLGWVYLLSYLLMLVLMLSPLGLYYLYRQRRELGRLPVLLWYSSLPLLLVLLVVSLSNQVGLHWPLISVVWLYASYAVLDERQQIRLFWFNALLSVLAAVTLLLLLANAMDFLKGTAKLRAPLYLEPQALCEQLPADTLFTLGYSSQATLSQHCRRSDLHVFASTSKFGREDDKRINFADFAGSQMRILLVKSSDLQLVTPYFKNYRLKPLRKVAGQTYMLFIGEDFNYRLYREKILETVYRNYYLPPEWLPKGHCGFKEKYQLGE